MELPILQVGWCPPGGGTSCRAASRDLAERIRRKLRPATPSAAPKPGGTLRYGISAEIVTLGFNQSNDFEILQGMYDPLLTYDDTLQPTPHLVESWEQNSDLTQIKLNLRRGVTFHNGREFTSDDVAYNVQRAADPTKSSPVQLVGLAKVWSVETPDKYTAILKTDQTRIGVFDLLTQSVDR